MAVITVSIGDAEAGGAAQGAESATIADEHTYLRQIEERRELLALSLSHYDELMADPRPDDPSWLNQLVYVFVGWATVIDGMPVP